LDQDRPGQPNAPGRQALSQPSAVPWKGISDGLAASSTAATRVGYAMGRVGLLPRVFTAVNDKYRTPTCVSCIAYYLPAQRRHFNVLLHLAIPLIGALALIPVLIAAFGIDFAHLGITGLTYLANLAPLICLVWTALRLVLLGYFMIKDRSRIAETRRVFTEQTPVERESV
jgi:amino acid transporter